MTVYTDLTCKEFVAQTASSAPMPGGGGAAALTAATGMALVNMVGNLTVGKKKYANVENAIKQHLVDGEILQNKFLTFVEEDAAVFEPLAKAYGLPATTDEEKAHKKQVLGEVSLRATAVPLKLANQIVIAMQIAMSVAEIGSKLVISDAGCGAQMLYAALKSARYNVLINLGGLTNEAFAAGAKIEIDQLILEADTLIREIERTVEERMQA